MPNSKTPTPRKKIELKPKEQPKTDMFTMACKRFDIHLVKEYKFHEERKWRFDYAIPEKKLAIEVDGAVWTQGRHTRGSGYVKDMEKFNHATMLGWRVLKFTPDQLFNVSTFETIIKSLL